eukprot:265711-Chlamydomonas_euryale.AAC.1
MLCPPDGRASPHTSPHFAHICVRSIGPVGGVPMLCPPGGPSFNVVPLSTRYDNNGGGAGGGGGVPAGVGLLKVWPLGGGWVVYVGASVTPADVVFAGRALALDRQVWRQLLATVFGTPG